MKEYLIKERPRTTIKIIYGFIFFSSIITISLSAFGYDNLTDYLILFPSNISEPWNYYRFITYTAYSGMAYWFYNSISFLLAGYVIEKRIMKKGIIILTLFSAIIGGLTCIIVNRNDELNLGVAGLTMISWSFGAAAIVCGLKYWKELKLFEKIITIVFMMGVIFIDFENDAGVVCGQIVVVIMTIISVIIFIRTNKKHIPVGDNFPK